MRRRTAAAGRLEQARQGAAWLIAASIVLCHFAALVVASPRQVGGVQGAAAGLAAMEQPAPHTVLASGASPGVATAGQVASQGATTEAEPEGSSDGTTVVASEDLPDPLTEPCSRYDSEQERLPVAIAAAE